jgi:hypothetical protein
MEVEDESKVETEAANKDEGRLRIWWRLRMGWRLWMRWRPRMKITKDKEKNKRNGDGRQTMHKSMNNYISGNFPVAYSA